MKDAFATDFTTIYKNRGQKGETNPQSFFNARKADEQSRTALAEIEKNFDWDKFNNMPQASRAEAEAEIKYWLGVLKSEEEKGQYTSYAKHASQLKEYLYNLGLGN
jgi:hypothetical protein